jgi:5'-3' exonuclease
MTYIIVDSKLMAYTASLHRNKEITQTLVLIDSAVKRMVDTGEVVGDYQVILGFDFGKSRYRTELLPTYKGHRVVGVADKEGEVLATYQKFQRNYRELLPALTEALGIMVVGVPNVEFDDLGSILTNFLTGNVVILSEDHDMLQLTLDYPKVRQFMPKSFTMVDYEKAVEITGTTSRAEFLVKKAITGDAGDSIRGLVQCGDVCFSQWLADRVGRHMSLQEWLVDFVALAESKPKYKIHREYISAGVSTFEELFRLNLKLGETMNNLAYLNEEEQRVFTECLGKPLVYDPQRFSELWFSCEGAGLNVFGDEEEAPSLNYLRGDVNV